MREGPSLGSCHCPHDVTVEPGAAYSHGGGVRCAATERYFIRPTHHCLAASGNSLQILGRVTFFRSSPVIYDGCTLALLCGKVNSFFKVFLRFGIVGGFSAGGGPVLGRTHKFRCKIRAPAGGRLHYSSKAGTIVADRCKPQVRGPRPLRPAGAVPAFGGAARLRRAGRGPASRRLHAAKQEGENQWERS